MPSLRRARSANPPGSTRRTHAASGFTSTSNVVPASPCPSNRPSRSIETGALRDRILMPTLIAEPTARNWYRAHNSSIVAAYLQHRDLAELEHRAERFFLNVVLLRVLYAHALVAAPRLALGRMAALGPALGDPRLGMAGIFLSLGRVLPDQYPLSADPTSTSAMNVALGGCLITR